VTLISPDIICSLNLGQVSEIYPESFKFCDSFDHRSEPSCNEYMHVLPSLRNVIAFLTDAPLA